MILFALLEVKVAVMAALSALFAVALFARQDTSFAVAGTSLYLSNGEEVNASDFVSIVQILGGGNSLSKEVSSRKHQLSCYFAFFSTTNDSSMPFPYK